MTNSNLLDCTTGRSAGFAPLRTRPDVEPELTPCIREVGSVAHQPAVVGILTPRIYRGDRVACGQLHQLDTSAREKGAAADDKASGRSRTNVEKAASIARLVSASSTWICHPMARAAGPTSRKVVSV